ncbi:hypothetical protein [Paenibacillus pinistramenti]|uniref:hypothetical protein n=1 Tax=Paenibacillus pinistramenti TaxID=1768003 RepID=UPI001107F3B7|nr:hypothetical protein [Paenibacillus pinistramenti]
MRKKRWIIGIPLLLAVVLAAAVAGFISYIRPTHELSLSYEEIDWEGKLLGIVQSGETALTLSEEEINNLCKKGLAERAAEEGVSYTIEGADFHLNGNQLSADAIVKWGPVRGEGTAYFALSFENGRLIMTPQSVKIRNHAFSPSLFKLKTIQIDPGQYLPELVQITKISFGEHEMKIGFSIDWMLLPGLLK